jgi:hypothetical protein
MKNKFFLVIVLSLIILLSFNLSGLNESKKDQSKTSAVSTITGDEKILFVGKSDSEGNSLADDNIILARLKKLGFKNIIFNAEKIVTPDDASGCAMVFISESVDSKRVVDKFIDVKIPVMFCEPFILDDMKLTPINAEDYGKIPEPSKTIKIIQPESALAAGLKGLVDVYKEEGTIGFGTPSKEATVIATAKFDSKKATIFYYDKGAKDAGDVPEPVPAKRFYFFMMSGFEKIMTEKGWKLFDAAIKWCLE